MGARKKFKAAHAGWPPLIYVKKEEDGSFKYFVCTEKLERLPFEIGETADIGTYTFAGHVQAQGVIKLGDDKP